MWATPTSLVASLSVLCIAAANIKTLIITGVSTQICVETAIRNGFDLGYKIIVPSDLVGTTSNDPATQTITLKRVGKTFGMVSSLGEISQILTGHAKITKKQPTSDIIEPI